jgi:hypothetical protein
MLFKTPVKVPKYGFHFVHYFAVESENKPEHAVG